MVRPSLTFSCRDLVVAFASPEETRYGLFSWQKHEVPCCTDSAIISSREIESIQWLGGDSRGTLPDGSPEIGLARWGWISRNLNLQRALRTREAALYLVNVVRRTYIVRPWRVHNSALRRIHSTHTHLPPLFISLPIPPPPPLPSFSLSTCPGFAGTWRNLQLQISKLRSFKWAAQQRLHLGTQREKRTKSPFAQEYSQFESLGQKGLHYLPELRYHSQYSKPWHHSKGK